MKDSFGIFSSEITERQVPTEIPIAKFGKNTYRKTSSGRNEFNFTDADADNCIKEFSTRAVDVVIDYNHQTLTGKEAPASGWIDKLEKTSTGLVAKVRNWTDRATGYFKNGEYRYFSPVIKFGSDGRASYLHSMALTNSPALDGIPSLVLSSEWLDNNNKRGLQMNGLKELLALSDIADDKLNEAVIGKVKELLDSKVGVDAFLKLHSIENLDGMTDKMKGLIPIEEKTKLEAQLLARDVDKAITVAMSEGKVTEGLKVWATSFATKDLVAFADWCKDAPAILPKGGISQADLKGKTLELTEAEIKICKATGINEEDFKKQKAKV